MIDVDRGLLAPQEKCNPEVLPIRAPELSPKSVSSAYKYSTGDADLVVSLTGPWLGHSACCTFNPLRYDITTETVTTEGSISSNPVESDLFRVADDLMSIKVAPGAMATPAFIDDTYKVTIVPN